MINRAPDTLTAHYLPDDQDPMLRPFVKEFMLDDDEFDRHMSDVAEFVTEYQDNIGPPPAEGTRFSFPISEYVIRDAGIQRTLDEISGVKPTAKSTIWGKIISKFLG
jgi:hypothetical protein